MFGYYHNNNINNNYNTNTNRNNNNKNNNNDNVLSSQVLHFFKLFFKEKPNGVAPHASPAETSFSRMEDIRRLPWSIP